MKTFISFVVGFALTVSLLLCNALTNGHPLEVTYAELETSGSRYNPSDTCQRNETDFGLNQRVCDCDSSCSIYGTCCLDSEFRKHETSPKRQSNLKCLNLYNSPGLEIFMVDSCKNDETFDNLCYSNPEESNDPFLIIPVTSNATGVTYKNYFCAVCNEEVDSEKLLFWDMQIWGNGTLYNNFSEPHFKFNTTMGSWTIYDGKNIETSTVVPVTLKIQKNLQATVKYCSSDLIENCSSIWRDEDIALKCKNYMAIVIGFSNVRYKNPHCALCNFENLNNIQCPKFWLPFVPASNFAPASGFAPASASFPASHVGVDIPLINLLLLEDRQKRCGKNMVDDKYADKCRCNSRVHSKENGKCVHKI